MTLKLFIKQHKSQLAVSVLLVIAFIIRAKGLYNNLFFGFEQGRDLLAVKELISGNVSLIGPWTSIPGFFHGILSYIILIPPFVVFNGDPYHIILVLVLINVLSFIFLYDAVRVLFGRNAALLTILYIVFSYSSIIYSRWLSNPNLVPAFMNLLLFALVRSKKNPKYLILIPLCWGFIFHLQAIVAVILIPGIILSFPLLRIKVTIRWILAMITLLFVMLSSYIIFDLRHEFLMSKSLVAYLQLSRSGDSLQKIHSIFVDEIQRVIYPTQRMLSIILFAFILISTIKFRKNKELLLLYLFLFSAPVFFLLTKSGPNAHYLMLTHLFLSILISAIISLSNGGYKTLSVLVYSLIILGNISGVLYKVHINNENFLHPAQYTYFSNQISIIDYVYEDAKGEKFSFDYFTIPYWEPAGWKYLFDWRGQNKYVYIPESNRTNIFYVVIEPDDSQPELSRDWYRDLNSKTSLLDYKVFGKLTVEKRIHGTNHPNSLKTEDYYSRFIQ